LRRRALRDSTKIQKNQPANLYQARIKTISLVHSEYALGIAVVQRRCGRLAQPQAHNSRPICVIHTDVEPSAQDSEIYSDLTFVFEYAIAIGL
jgi:hypothetical protein